MKNRIIFYSITVISVLGFVTFSALNVAVGGFFTPAITCGTFAYHFVMRLTVASVFDLIPKSARIYSSNKPFSAGEKERAFYEKLKIKKWKDKAFTFKKELFKINSENLSEVVYQMKKAELIHAVIIPLSYLSLLFTLACDSFLYFWIFFATTFLTDFIDLSSVIIQRYNLSRLISLLKNKTDSNTGIICAIYRK